MRNWPRKRHKRYIWLSLLLVFCLFFEHVRVTRTNKTFWSFCYGFQSFHRQKINVLFVRKLFVCWLCVFRIHTVDRTVLYKQKSRQINFVYHEWIRLTTKLIICWLFEHLFKTTLFKCFESQITFTNLKLTP